ncbi:MAG: ATP-dependent DNA helicase [Candidatus Galacturonibacter soehngenii]|nr:ATP-dependent DNA helicase [Candidatus Galacturonibacter soehngenii]
MEKLSWIDELLYRENKDARKQKYKKIGSDVYGFFQDIAPEYGYEDREGQWDMACEIAGAMKNKEHIVVEAGVGIGKSFAYIVPLLYYHKEYNKPVIIATSTIALQEQLAEDIRKIEDILNYYPDVIIAKGQNHFICKNRSDVFFTMRRDEKFQRIYKEIDKGGVEKSDWEIVIPDKIWNQINIKEFNPVYCRQNCTYKDECYYYNLRQQLLATQGIILCNQDLLTINLQKRCSYTKEFITDKFQYVVIDEAHNLETKVRNCYTNEISYYSLTKTIEQARKMNRNIGSSIDMKIDAYYGLLDLVFANLELQISKQNDIAKAQDLEIERYTVDNRIPELNSLKECVHDIFLEASMQFGSDDSYRNKDYEIELAALELQEDFFTSLLEDDSEDIFWMNIKSDDKQGISILKCPKEVNKLTQELYFSDNNFLTILTSATITSGNSEEFIENYKYFIDNTNFPLTSSFIAEPKQSPFNYDEHTMLYYTEHMPHPSRERKKFIEAGVNEIIQLLDISKGKALILFTSKNDMKEVYERLKNKTPYKVLIQNENSSQNQVLNEFKQDINSVLLGTGTYWEGISVEGKALSNLIIFKLPFPVPEPIIDYKRSIAQNGLMEVSVPEMIIKLKQGIGRLIRSEKDVGIVSIIDSRVGDSSNAPYKQIIWDSLPIGNRTNDINKLKKFYDSL